MYKRFNDLDHEVKYCAQLSMKDSEKSNNLGSGRPITYIYVVSELSLLSIIWHAIRRNKILILEVEPIVPYLFIFLKRLLKFFGK